MTTRFRTVIVLFCLSSCDDAVVAADGKPAPAKPDAPTAAAPTKDVAPAPVDVASLPAATELLEKAVEAQGGRARWDALTSLYFEGETSVMAQKVGGKMKLWWQAGDFYVEAEMIGVGIVRAGKQGDVIWTEDPVSGLRNVTGAEAEQHAWASSPSLPAQWQRHFAKAETIGQREIGGKKAYDVQLTAKSGSTVTLSFDAETGLQLAQSFKQITPMGEVPLSIELQDYREVDGFKLPFVQVTDLKIAKATQTLTKVEFGVPVDATKFAMPTSGTTVVKPGPKPVPKPHPEH